MSMAGGEAHADQAVSAPDGLQEQRLSGTRATRRPMRPRPTIARNRQSTRAPEAFYHGTGSSGKRTSNAA
jgi:hypothetical protein